MNRRNFLASIILSLSTILDRFIDKNASPNTIYNLGFHWLKMGYSVDEILDAYLRASSTNPEIQTKIEQARKYWHYRNF